MILVAKFFSPFSVESPECVHLIFDTMGEILPEGLPHKYDETEPPRFAFKFGQYDNLVAHWGEGLFWTGPGPWVGGISHVSRVRHTMIDFCLPYCAGLGNRPIEFLATISRHLQVDYSYLHIMNNPPEDHNKLFSVLTSFHLKNGLPGVPLACCYGSPYINLFDRERLLSQPADLVQDLATELILAVICPFDRLASDAKFLHDRMKVVQSHLGEGAFSIDGRSRAEVIPHFQFLQGALAGCG